MYLPWNLPTVSGNEPMQVAGANDTIANNCLGFYDRSLDFFFGVFCVENLLHTYSIHSSSTKPEVSTALQMILDTFRLSSQTALTSLPRQNLSQTYEVRSYLNPALVPIGVLESFGPKLVSRPKLDISSFELGNSSV